VSSTLREFGKHGFSVACPSWNDWIFICYLDQLDVVVIRVLLVNEVDSEPSCCDAARRSRVEAPTIVSSDFVVCRRIAGEAREKIKRWCADLADRRKVATRPAAMLLIAEQQPPWI